MDWYVGLYLIKEVVFTHTVKLQLPIPMRIHLVVNISQIIWYKKQIEGQKMEKVKLVEVEKVEEWEMENVLNKRKIKGVVKYLVQWKEFIAEYDSWEREKDLKNTKEVIAEFKIRVNTEVRRQEKLNMMKERNFKRRKLLGKYTVKILYE